MIDCVSNRRFYADSVRKAAEIPNTYIICDFCAKKFSKILVNSEEIMYNKRVCIFDGSFRSVSKRKGGNCFGKSIN